MLLCLHILESLRAFGHTTQFCSQNVSWYAKQILLWLGPKETQVCKNICSSQMILCFVNNTVITNNCRHGTVTIISRGRRDDTFPTYVTQPIKMDQLGQKLKMTFLLLPKLAVFLAQVWCKNFWYQTLCFWDMELHW